MKKQQEVEAVIAFAKTIRRNVVQRFPHETRKQRQWRHRVSVLVRLSAFYDAGLVPPEEQSKYDVIFDEAYRMERAARHMMVEEKCRKEFARLRRRSQKRSK